ncbi:MAG: hypothetical protein JOZ54_23520 [Acidobacteria bacterium]|nr:hypothetical protein [Acidobacteriota bacterium]
MLHAIVLLVATALPAATRTGWMTPESFHLTVGMPRAAVMKTLSDNAWQAKKGRDEDELLIDYTSTKALTLQFRQNRLTSIRFELFGMLPEVHQAFDEQKTALAQLLGAPRVMKPYATIIYDAKTPNVFVVMTENKERGLPMLAVRYFDPR